MSLVFLVVPVALGAEAGVAIHLIQAAGIVLAPVVLAVVEVLAAVAPHIAGCTLTPGTGGGLEAAPSFPLASVGARSSPCNPPLPPYCSPKKKIYPFSGSQKKWFAEEGAHLGPWLVEMQVESCWQGLSSSEQKLGGCSQNSPARQKRGCPAAPGPEEQPQSPC